MQKGFEPATASAEGMFLKDLPEGVTLLPRDWIGETTRVRLDFVVSQQAVKNKEFDLVGFIKAKFDNALTAIRHRRGIEELRLTRQLRVIIDQKGVNDNTQIFFNFEYERLKDGKGGDVYQGHQGAGAR